MAGSKGRGTVTIGPAASRLAVACVLLGCWPTLSPGVHNHGYAETPKDQGRQIRFEECGTHIMRIEFERSGGFSGLRVAATIEADSLSKEESDELCHLVEDAGFFDLPTRIAGPATQSDQFSYKVTVDDGGQRHTVVLENSEPPPLLRPLVDWLSRAARGRR
jgi:hypothetical protein